LQKRKRKTKSYRECEEEQEEKGVGKRSGEVGTKR
jgi:hypothetical protein